MNLSDGTDISNMCLREMIYTAQFPVIFSGTIDWDILEWTSQDWSNAFRDQLLPFRCGTKKCQETPIWESQCETEYHTFEELITFSKDEVSKWWYFDYKHISNNFADRGDIFETVSWKNLGFPDKGAQNSTIWIGSPGAHTPCHFDSYGCNVVAQVLGKKRWILFPPSETENLKPTRVPYEESSVYSSINFSCSQQLKKNLKLNKCYIVDMNPGDVLLIPPKWWHYVENVSLAVSINMWIPLVRNTEVHKQDDLTRLDEALVRFLISSLTSDAPDHLKNFLLNPNELDLKGGNINLDIIEFCRKKIEECSEEMPVETKADQYNLTSHCHKYKIIRSISVSEFYQLLPNCNSDHAGTSEELVLDGHVNTLKSVIDAFCHPDIIFQVRNKFFH